MLSNLWFYVSPIFLLDIFFFFFYFIFIFSSVNFSSLNKFPSNLLEGISLNCIVKII